MLLSDAIIEGSKLKPQGRGQLEADGKTCAIGAAIEGAGYQCHFGPVSTDVFPQLLRRVEKPCKCAIPTDELTLYCVVTHLNDFHRWTREACAGWVMTVEKQIEAERSPIFKVQVPSEVRH